MRSMITEESIRDDHPLVVSHQLLERAKQSGAHQRVIENLSIRTRELSAEVVTNWRQTNNSFKILDAIQGNETLRLKNEP